jgi:predicted adenine nucleotide alpha hydrolase (AANH) superfamily ATPase
MKKVAKIYIILCWSLFVFILMTAVFPLDGSAVDGLHWDKLIHFIIFGLLAFLIIFSFARKHNLIFITFITIILGSFYVFVLEWVQLFLPHRFFSYADIVAGISGIIAFSLGYYFYLSLSPAKNKRILLHICCAGCGAYVSQLLKQEYEVTLLFYNPNIHPRKEYKKRKKEVKKISFFYDLDVIMGKYNHNNWLNKIDGYQTEKEGGERCVLCYEDRLEETVRMAKDGKFDLFTTTLTVSPHKNADKINEIGRNLGREYGVPFLEKNFKKQDGFKKASQLSKQLKLFRQNYCGCEFSKRKD